MKTLKIEISYKFLYRMIVFLFLCIFVVIAALRIASAYPAAEMAQTEEEYEISFKSVRVTSKDTLWSIAKENYSPEYGTFKEYLREIMRCNSLTSEEINAGSSLVIPIYLTESVS